ncbi:MAG TPA: hypothetical protein VMT55_00715, partial [Candidatus Sulfotelmatobacter sp.]|nr:hypothetical protein [Candidatus Sulfotelmatobacter sp.]
LDIDHRNQFTPAALRVLLDPHFARVKIAEKEMLDSRLLQAVLPPLFSLPLSLLYALRLIRPKFSFRLFAEGLLGG